MLWSHGYKSFELRRPKLIPHNMDKIEIKMQVDISSKEVTKKESFVTSNGTEIVKIFYMEKDQERFIFAGPAGEQLRVFLGDKGEINFIDSEGNEI